MFYPMEDLHFNKIKKRKINTYKIINGNNENGRK